MQYFTTNPDLVAEGCIVTGLAEDGVVFPEIEPIGYMHTFIGRTALVEAASRVLDVTPDDLNQLPARVAEIAELKSQLEAANAALDRYRDIVEALRAAFTLAESTVGAPPNELDETPPKTKRTRTKKPVDPAPADLE
jgi:hypothetical protein